MRTRAYNKSAPGRPGNTMNPTLIFKDFSFFANRNTPINMQVLNTPVKSFVWARLFTTHGLFCRTTTQAKQQDTRFLFFFFKFRLANHQFRLANPTNIANANPDPPTPADRAVPIHGWRTKKVKKGDQREGALGSSFPGFSLRAVLGWWFDKITHVW